MTSFILETDGSDGLFLIDKANLMKLTPEQLAALDILLDRTGKTELRTDFPNQNWNDVWNRETKLIRDFLNSGNGFIAIFEGADKVCGLEIIENVQVGTPGNLYLPDGNLIGVSVSEAIQCLSYPGLQMSVPFQKSVDPGWYSIKHKHGLHFSFAKANGPLEVGDNLLML